MRIKESRGWAGFLKDKIKSASSQWISASQLKKPATIGLIIFGLALFISAIYYRDEIKRHVVRPTLYRLGARPRPLQFIIDIKQKEFQKLAFKRETALSKDVLLSSSEDYVPAKITIQDKTYPVELRLKGDSPDHWQDEFKWSFRIKVDDEKTILGMRQFSIQDPDTRGYIIDWLFHEFQKYNGLIHLRYDFVDVIINGKPMGLYAIEEHFDKILIENNQRREGPIIRFNDSMYWQRLAGSSEEQAQYQEAYWTGPIEPFHPKRTRRKKDLFIQYQKGKNLLESYRQGYLQTSEVFDVDKLAMFFAIFDVWGNPHAHEYHNVRFYYNPVTSLLEPIGYDSKNMGILKQLTGATTKNVRKKYWGTWELPLFDDHEFMKKYIAAVKKLASKVYIDAFFKQIDAPYQEKLGILYDNFPKYEFTKKDYLYENIKFIHKALNPIKGVSAYFYQFDRKLKKVELQMSNNQTLPVVILGILWKEDILSLPIANEPILEARDPATPSEFNLIEFQLHEEFDEKELPLADTKILFKILGTDIGLQADIYEWPALDQNFLANRIMMFQPNINKVDFLHIDNARSEIYIKPGVWTLKHNLIIPKGFTVFATENTEIRLTNSAKIISYSPIYFVGTDRNPILITSDDSGQGLAVINAKKKSLVKNVIFSNLAAPKQEGWELTGAVNFYESPVSIEQSRFSHNRDSDDNLNIVRSKFRINHTVFENSFADALDVDFSQGNIYRSKFIECGPGGDGIDFSGSSVQLSNITIKNVRDKGLSIGEHSYVQASGVKISGAEIAIASKDMSELNIKNLELKDYKIGLAVYQKKEEFGPARMFVEHGEGLNIGAPYYIQDKSTLMINDVIIEPDSHPKKISLNNL